MNYLFINVIGDIRVMVDVARTAIDNTFIHDFPDEKLIPHLLLLYKIYVQFKVNS